jgi:hypothetical protein
VLRAEAGRAPGTPVVAARALTALTALALLVAGCGDEEDDGESDSPTVGTEVTVTLDPDGPGGQEPLTETAGCDAAEEGPCAGLTIADIAPIDPQTPCTEIYGGPDEATLQGTIGGEPVDATFTRANGCEIDRFDRIAPLLKELFPDYEPGASTAG